MSDISQQLISAAIVGDEKVVELLLSKGANVEALDDFDFTALHWAAQNGHEKVTDLLLSNGANIEAVDRNGHTALHWAVKNGHEKVVKLLLSNGADINAADMFGRTTLIIAVLSEEVKAALVLISNGVDVKKTDNDHRNALYYAKQKGLVNLVEILSEPEKAKHAASRLLFESNAVNDSSRFGIDRLGVSPYAKAIYNVLSNADIPLCVGLFGRWGSGKSFLIQLIKYNFDKGVSLHPNSNELLQWYEEKWMINPLKPEATASRLSDDGNFIDRCELRLTCCGDAIMWHVFGCVAIIAGESSQYLIKLVGKLLCDELRYLCCSLCGNIYRTIWKGLLFCYTGSSVIYYQLESKSDDDDIEKQKETKNSDSQTEHVFVDFNAWEYSQSDELWAGLIRNIYRKIELRLQQHDNPKHRIVIQNEVANSLPRDWKEVWRLQKAEETLTKCYGGSIYLHARLWFVAVVSAFLIFFLVKSGIVSMIYYKYFDMHYQTQQQPMNSTTSFNQTTLKPSMNEKQQLTIEDARTGFSIILSVIAIIAGAVPIGSFLSFVNETVNTSRGDAIFEEAKGVKDKIGFLSRVRAELQELFDFMKQYEHETRIKLKLVVFVDDLDRCLEGRNVKVLEAIQLILAIPGAPVICFLAIDSRVLVASIEKTINNSLAIEDALISGWEYLDKIVQIPFCLPDPPPEKVQRYVERCLTQPYDERTIFQLFAAIVERANYYRLVKSIRCEEVFFRMKSLPNNEEGIISYNTFNDFLVSSRKSSAHVDLILSLAPMLLVEGESYKTLYQNSLKQNESTCGLNHGNNVS